MHQNVFIVSKKSLGAESAESAKSAHINVKSSDVCIVCGSSKPRNAPIKIDISDSPQSPISGYEGICDK